MQETVPLPIGETIRQMRRQQSLTQTELGGDRFSKSYVSAVEREKIVPSFEAMHFFAERLGQHIDHFEKLLQQTETTKRTSVLNDTQMYNRDEHVIQEKILPLLDILLEGTGFSTLPFLQEFTPLAPNFTLGLSSDVQGRYAFLVGLIAQQKQDFATALRSLEHALTLAPYKYRPAILDALGTNYYYTQSYYTALDYHKRALGSLQEMENEERAEDAKSLTTLALRLKIEFHCGNDYHTLGAHRQACEHFEQARQQLRSAHDIQTAAQLYLKLGYSTYADIYQRTAFTPTTEDSVDEIERGFQRATSYFVQSRTLYQVSSDRLGEAWARLSQSMVLLDFSMRRRQAAQEKAQTTGTMPSINCTNLLDEAEEQCRQVLMGWEVETPYPTLEIEIALYTALAYLIRVSIQRAIIAQMNEFADTAVRERSIAVYLCQKVLDTLVEPGFPWTIAHEIGILKESALINQAQPLPRIPEAVLHSNPVLCYDLTRSIVLFATGEVAEMLGRAATRFEYAEACFERTSQSFQAALDASRLIIPMPERDISYLYRVYQRCINILEERKQVRPETEEKTNQALLHLLKDALQTSYRPVL